MNLAYGEEGRRVFAVSAAVAPWNWADWAFAEAFAAAQPVAQAEASDPTSHTLARHMHCHHTGPPRIHTQVDAHTVAVEAIVEVAVVKTACSDLVASSAAAPLAAVAVDTDLHNLEVVAVFFLAEVA